MDKGGGKVGGLRVGNEGMVKGGETRGGLYIMGGEKKGELWEGKGGLWMMKRGSVKGGNKMEGYR
jgi:hypothetical protein